MPPILGNVVDDLIISVCVFDPFSSVVPYDLISLCGGHLART